MLFIHFTPKSNLKRIKRIGLVPGKDERGIFLRPLIQGEKTLANDWTCREWWDRGSVKGQKEMAKIIVRLPTNAMVRWGHCGGSRSAQAISVRELGKQMASWRITKPDEIPPSGRRELDLMPGVVQTWFGLEVLYEGKIPPKWIVKILDHTNTDERTARYRRRTRRAENEE